MKRLATILGMILLLNVSAIGVIASGDGEKTIRVYGTIELDGEPVEDADIVVKNLDQGYEETTITDEEGFYEVYINGKNHDDVEVNVDFDDSSDDRQFEIHDGGYNYEINFEFESSTVRKNYHKMVNFAFGLNWGFWEWIVCIFLVLLIIWMIKKIFFENNHRYHRYEGNPRYERRY